MLTYMLRSDIKLPLYEQLYNCIKNDIISGEIKPGDKLPSKRVLAGQLKISVITVETAYYQLASEGYIYSKARSGYFVNTIGQEGASIQTDTTLIPIKENITRSDYKYDFGTDSSDTENFPFSVWISIMRRVLHDSSKELLNKCELKGLYALRSEIAAFLKAYRNISCDPGDIVVGAGSEYLLNIIIQLLKNKRYAVENPGYHKIAKILNSYNAETDFIPLDNQGVCMKPLIYSGAKVLHVSPSHQFPTGITTPIKRRYELLQWAADSNGYIIEDDYDSEFSYSGKPVPALKSLDMGGRVIYMNTFTKSLAPSLRISYMVLPPELSQRFDRELKFYSNTVSCFEQYTLARFMSEGYFERHLNRMRNIYKGRISAIKNTLNSMDEKIVLKGQDMGLHVVLEVNEDSEKLAKRAEERGVFVRDINRYYVENTHNTPALVLGYTGISKEDIPKGLKKIFEN